MDRLVIEGGCPLRGTVTAAGAKNAALPCLLAALLGPEKTVLSRVPPLRDVQTAIQLLRHIGAAVEVESGTVSISAPRLTCAEAPYELVKTMRAGVLALGPLIARQGEARVSLPGGCAIGERPINLHLAGLEKLGVSIDLREGYVLAHVPRPLRGAKIVLDLPTVTGTMNLMMAATAAAGETVIENAAREPEVADLAAMLRQMGAQIEGAGSSVIAIHGPSQLHGCTHRIIPDRIETGTYLLAGAITGGDLTVADCCPAHLDSVLEKLREIGVGVEAGADWLRVRAAGRCRGTEIKTQPFPGFATDMQAQFMALLSLAQGTSAIRETIFENRFMHVAELKRMGAEITIHGASAVIEGVEYLSGAPVMATDLRASASLVLAALAARGTTFIQRVYHLDRGYEKMEQKLAAVGASIQREKEEKQRSS